MTWLGKAVRKQAWWILVKSFSTISFCLLVLKILYLWIYSLLSTSVSFTLFKPSDNIQILLIHCIGFAIDSESYYNRDKNMLTNSHFQGAAFLKGTELRADMGLGLMPSPKFVPSSKQRFLQHDQSMIRPAVVKQRGLRHQFGMQLGGFQNGSTSAIN